MSPLIVWPMPTTHEREITAPVDLCLPDGRLDPGAVGWTRRPLHRANLRGWGRRKKWEYWGVVTPRHVVGLVLSSLDYAAVHSVYVLDRETGSEIDEGAALPWGRGAVLPDRCGTGEAAAGAGPVRIRLDQRPDGTTLRATAPGVEVELEIPLPEGHESLGLVVPWGPRRFQYTVKDLGRPVSGRLRLPSGEFTVDEADSFAILDHGRGKWPYSARWNWAAGCDRSRSGRLGTALQLGGKWTEGTGTTENALFHEGRLHKIGEELRWSYDRSAWTRPWRIEGPRVEVDFHPFHEKVSRTRLGVVAAETHQCFGHFTGRAQTDDGAWIDLDGLTGWAEEARNRW